MKGLEGGEVGGREKRAKKSFDGSVGGISVRNNSKVRRNLAKLGDLQRNSYDVTIASRSALPRFILADVLPTNQVN
jgi:hypothetical protein